MDAQRIIAAPPSLGRRHPELIGVGDWERVFSVVDGYVTGRLTAVDLGAPRRDLEQEAERLSRELLPGVRAAVAVPADLTSGKIVGKVRACPTASRS